MYGHILLMSIVFFFVLYSRRGHLDVAKYLVNDAHCDPNVGNKDGETSLHLACR